jgi:hypothetical protein
MESPPHDASSQKRPRREDDDDDVEEPTGHGKKLATHQSLKQPKHVQQAQKPRDRDPLLSDDESELESEVEEEDTGLDKPPRKTLEALHTQLDAMFI